QGAGKAERRLRYASRGLEQLSAKTRKERPQQTFDHENEPDGNDKIAHSAGGTGLLGRRRLLRSGWRCSFGCWLRLCWRCRLILWLGSRCCWTRRLVEIFEEIRVGAQQQPRVARGQRRLISLHRAVEAEELWILVKGQGIDAVPLGITVTADAFGFPSRVVDVRIKRVDLPEANSKERSEHPLVLPRPLENRESNPSPCVQSCL